MVPVPPSELEGPQGELRAVDLVHLPHILCERDLKDLLTGSICLVA